MFHYQPVLPQGPALSRSQLSRLNPTSIYKRLIIMLRSLFCYVRVLPAYRLFRVCKVGVHSEWHWWLGRASLGAVSGRIT